MTKIDYIKIYRKQIVEMATESKETLTIRKDIIIDVEILVMNYLLLLQIHLLIKINII